MKYNKKLKIRNLKNIMLRNVLNYIKLRRKPKTLENWDVDPQIGNVGLKNVLKNNSLFSLFSNKSQLENVAELFGYNSQVQTMKKLEYFIMLR